MSEVAKEPKAAAAQAVVRHARREDMSAVADMIQELANFEKMPNGPQLTVENLQMDGFDLNPPVFRCLVAELPDHSVVGYALGFPTYSTWEGRSFMLEDLYVRPQNRMCGIGGKLFDAVAKEAVEWGSSRLDFHVLAWNPARQFYALRGAEDLSAAEGWAFYRLAGQRLRDRATAAAAAAAATATQH